MKICPKCGGPTTVLQVVKVVARRRTRRRRQCLACDHRFTTYELTAEDYSALARRTVDARRRVRKYLQTIERMLQ